MTDSEEGGSVCIPVCLKNDVFSAQGTDGLLLHQQSCSTAQLLTEKSEHRPCLWTVAKMFVTAGMEGGW